MEASTEPRVETVLQNGRVTAGLMKKDFSSVPWELFGGIFVCAQNIIEEHWHRNAIGKVVLLLGPAFLCQKATLIQTD